MKTGALLLLFALGVPGLRLLTMVRDRNAAVAEATAAYRRGEALLAAHSFQNALATAGPRRTPDPRLVLNLGHAQARAGQLNAARATYGRLLTGSPDRLNSVARQQLAVLAAGRGELAQAANLLRQAIILDPANAGARYDFEVVSDYLAQRPNRPQLLPPPSTPALTPKTPSAKDGAQQPNKPAEKEGADRRGETNDPKPAPNPGTPPVPRPDAAGQSNNRHPSALPGAAAGSRTPGASTPQPTASGNTPGTQRGLDRHTGAGSSNKRSTGIGSEAATAADLSLQTQRERLQAMSLSPAQARQLLETLRAQEQQYLQQRTRPAAQKPDPSRPTW